MQKKKTLCSTFEIVTRENLKKSVKKTNASYKKKKKKKKKKIPQIKKVLELPFTSLCQILEP